MEEKTQIEVKIKTRESLKDIKLTKRESYDEIINRLIDENGTRKENQTH